MAKQNSLSVQQKIGLRIKELRNKAKYSQENLGFEANLHLALNQRNRIRYSLAQFESLKVKRDSSTSGYLSY